MTMTDPISDLLTRIRNGQQVKKASISCPASKIKLAILKVIKEEGFIRDYSLTEDTRGKIIEISLKYYHGEPVIKEIVRISKPGLRVYSSVKDMPVYKNNMGISIISTSKGVMTNFKAKEINIGGEVICRIY
ncbi:MAG: 30S ribosomal protein S8 [Pseudomonadota bacterium]|nr:30S ribosomal protein S8 [Pseudomonadota bacterium]